MIISKKLSIAAIATIALALGTTANSNVLAASNSAAVPFKDLSDASPWARGLIQEAQEKQFMNGDREGLFRPMQAVTRQEAAIALAKALDLQVSNSGASSFSDVPADSWSAGAIEAVRQQGWMKGDSNGAFRPKDEVTREELASVLARAAKLEAEVSKDDEASPFADSHTVSAWAKESVSAVVSSGIMVGSDGKFHPQQSVLRQELAAILLRVESANSGLQKIEKVENGKVTIGETTYAVVESLQPFFAASNAPVLTNAGIRFESADGQITRLLALELVTPGKAAASGQPEFSGNLVLDGGKAIIDGNVKIAADYITIQNISINGDLEIGEELNNDFYAQHISVKGSTHVNGGDENTVVFDQSSLQGMNIRKEGVRVEAVNKTVVQRVQINSKLSGLWGDESITYQQVTLGADVEKVSLYAHISHLELVSGTGATTVTGNGSFDSVTIQGTGEVSLLSTGRIGTITVVDKDAKITLPSNVTIQNIVLPEGVNPEQVIANYDAVKSRIVTVNDVSNPGYAPGTGSGSPSTGGSGGSGSGSGGGGSPSGPESPPPSIPDSGNPFLSASYENRKVNSADGTLIADKAGTVYYMAVPLDANVRPTVEQVKSGTLPGNVPFVSGSIAVTANQLAVYKLEGLEESEAYGVWAVFKSAGSGEETKSLYLTYISNYIRYTTNVLPYSTKNLSQIRIQFTGELTPQMTSTLDPSALIKNGRLRNYGYGFIPITSVSWDLDIPDMPILNLHFDPVTLGNGNSYRLDWSYVKDALYIMEIRPDGSSTRHGFGGHGSYSGEDVVSLITTQLAIEAGTAADPAKAEDVLHVLKAYPSPLNQELGLIDFNAQEYQKALANAAGRYATFADVKRIITAVNDQYPAPSNDAAAAIRGINNSQSATAIESQLKRYAVALNIDAAAYGQLHEASRLKVAQSILDQRSLLPQKEFTSIGEIQAAFEQAKLAVSAVPVTLSFIDTDTRSGYVGGEVSWTPGADESTVEAYELLWGANGQALESIATIDKNTGNRYILPQGTAIPSGASQLLVRAVLQDGASTIAIYTTVTDTLPAAPEKPNVSKDDRRNILIGADASMEFSVDGEVTWIPYDEQNPPLFPGDVTVRVRVQADPVNQVPAGKVEMVTFVDNVYMYVGINDVSNTFDAAYISSAMEYSADDGATWTTYDEVNPPEFPGDLTILLREKGGDYLPPGPAKSFTFTSKVHMQFPGGNYLWTTSNGAEYSLNGGAWQPLPYDQQVAFQPGDVVEVREAARGVFPAGAIETYNF